MKTNKQFQEEVEDMHVAFRNICKGHKHSEVLLALGYVLVDALDKEFYDTELPLNERINYLMEAMKGIVIRLTRERRDLPN